MNDWNSTAFSVTDALLNPIKVSSCKVRMTVPTTSKHTRMSFISASGAEREGEQNPTAYGTDPSCVSETFLLFISSVRNESLWSFELWCFRSYFLWCWCLSCPWWCRWILTRALLPSSTSRRRTASLWPSNRDPDCTERRASCAARRIM